MKINDVIFLIDIQNGFANPSLTHDEGGSLYVPGGEEVGENAAHLIRSMKGAVFVLSQDFHPQNHISFASNHADAEPFSTLHLKRDETGLFVPVPAETPNAMTQTLWPDHCIQNTKSALFVPEIMASLPDRLVYLLETPHRLPFLYAKDRRHNEFYVIRKGMNANIDSYGIATENDGISKTEAPFLFRDITSKIIASKTTEVRFSIGGLAENYCVEFSHQDLFSYFPSDMKQHNIHASCRLLTDITRGIPAKTKDGSWPDLDATKKRLKAFGTTTGTTQNILRLSRHRRLKVDQTSTLG